MHSYEIFTDNKSLNEWIEVASQNFQTPNFENAEHIGNFETPLAIFDVLLLIVNREIIFAASLDNKIMGFIGFFFYYDKILIGKNAQALIKQHGILSGLIDFIITHEKFSIMNDFEMSAEGIKLWNHLLNINNYTPAIYDLKLLKKYPLSDIGQLTEDNVVIRDPKNDNSPEPYDLSNIKDNEQRFLYIITSSHMVESVIQNINIKKATVLETLNPKLRENLKNLNTKQSNTLLQKVYKFNKPWP